MTAAEFKPCQITVSSATNKHDPLTKYDPTEAERAELRRLARDDEDLAGGMNEYCEGLLNMIPIFEARPDGKKQVFLIKVSFQQV